MSSRIDEIVQSASSNDGEQLIAQILRHQLPPVLDELVDDYVTLEGARDRFMWKWVHALAPENTLPCVSHEYRDAVPIDKTLTILFITLLDDALEKSRAHATFEEAAKIPFPDRVVDTDRAGVDASYVAFAQRVWDTLDNRLSQAPEYDRYLDLLRFDIDQAINAIRYTSLVIDQPGLATLHDLHTYESHNMVMFAYADIDLMHAPRSAAGDLPILRRGIWHAQQMTRIGNWVSTWERELREGDYSSGVVVYALQNGIVTETELAAIQDPDAEATYAEIVDRIHEYGVEQVFLDLWDDHYDILVDLDYSIESMDLTPFIAGLKEVLRYHLASKGLK